MNEHTFQEYLAKLVYERVSLESQMVDKAVAAAIEDGTRGVRVTRRGADFTVELDAEVPYGEIWEQNIPERIRTDLGA